MSFADKDSQYSLILYSEMEGTEANRFLDKFSCLFKEYVKNDHCLGNEF